jgi:hypothetical protein
LRKYTDNVIFVTLGNAHINSDYKPTLYNYEINGNCETTQIINFYGIQIFRYFLLLIYYLLQHEIIKIEYVCNKKQFN